MACNWLMMTSSGEDNWPWEFGSAHRQKNKKLKTTFNRAFKIELFSKYSRSSRKRTPSGREKSVRNWSWPLTRMVLVSGH